MAPSGSAALRFVRTGPTKNAPARERRTTYRYRMQIAPTDRTTVRRQAERADYDRDLVNAVIDEAVSCHVGFAVDGRPWVIPTIHARIDDRLYLHGAVANHMLRSLAGGIEACVTMTLVDALVLARSAFHHSMNYRSVMVFGRLTKVGDDDEKRAALHALVEHVVPGRTTDARPPSDHEVRTTSVLTLPITEASAKVRTGGPIDEPEDLALPVWAGLLPVSNTYGSPIPEPDSIPAVPAYVTGYARPSSRR
jgi:nitroimidazol reductase NimA-like FMN-containing flavoprotein (pyridoxamine 5'-phosphate oxidase superfamily)